MHNIISNFCIHYSLLTKKSFVSSADPLYPSWLPLTPSPLVTSTMFFVEYKTQNQMNKNKPNKHECLCKEPVPTGAKHSDTSAQRRCDSGNSFSLSSHQQRPRSIQMENPAHSQKISANLAADSTTSLLTSACVMKRKTSAIPAGKRDKKMLLQKVSFLKTQYACSSIEHENKPKQQWIHSDYLGLCCKHSCFGQLQTTCGPWIPEYLAITSF